MGENLREVALKIIQKTAQQGAYPNVLLDRAFSTGTFSPEDRALITHIVYGVLENRLYIDWVIQRFSRLQRDRISPRVYDVLRLSVFQLLFLNRVPSFAVVNEGVKIAKKMEGNGAAGFVNGMLRSIIREKEKTLPPARDKGPLRHISIKYSHPEWMVKDWAKRFGIDFTEDMCNANNKPPIISIRVNTLKTDKKGLKEVLNSQGIVVRDGMYSDTALIADRAPGLFSCKAFEEGLFYVQDESSMIAAEVLAPKPGHTVVDLCSAPGGKATHMAQIMADKGSIISRDINKDRLKRVEENAKRLGITCIKTEIYDALINDQALTGLADKVLLDAPCSGFGVIRRRPDIKWKKERGHYNDLARIQGKMLVNAASYLKPGGHLLYSTCTIMPEENMEVVDTFMKKNSGFVLSDISMLLPETLSEKSTQKGYLQLFPNVHGTDGFFMCRLKRV